MNAYKDEIIRAYRVLGAERAQGQNWIDIHAWAKNHYISHEEEKKLLSFNRLVYAEEIAKGNF